MSVKRDLLNAAALIREKGWKQGGGVDPCGQRCAFLALLAVVPPDVTYFDRLFPAVSVLAAQLGHKPRDEYDVGQTQVERWNDAPGRTAEEVIAALEAAAEAAPDA